MGINGNALFPGREEKSTVSGMHRRQGTASRGKRHFRSRKRSDVAQWRVRGRKHSAPMSTVNIRYAHAEIPLRRRRKSPPRDLRPRESTDYIRSSHCIQKAAL